MAAHADGTAFRLRPELRERLKAEAEARGISSGRLANKLIQEGLDNLCSRLPSSG